MKIHELDVVKPSAPAEKALLFLTFHKHYNITISVHKDIVQYDTMEFRFTRLHIASKYHMRADMALH